jgi:subtilisin-like proprotein convertase family protein
MLLTIYQKALFLCVLLLAGTGLPQVQAQKQQAVDQKGQTASRKASLQPNELFSPDWESATKAYGAEVRGGVILNFDAKKAAGFLKKNTTRFTLELPTGQGDETLILHMQRSHIFGKDFKVFTSSNRNKPFDYKGGLHFHGVVEGDAHSKVAISVFDNEVMGLIITHDGNYNLGRVKNSSKGHILYLDRDLLKKPEFNCGMEDDHHEYTDEELNGAPKAAGDCISVYLEIDKSLVDNKGSVANATNFVTGAFNQNVLIYNAEMINMNISEIFVWDTPDPYSGPSSSQYLAQFQANTGAFNGDLGHLVALVNNGGIAAGFSGICNPDRDESLCYSGLEDFYNNVPVYSFTVMVLAHEMGHLIGSRHTHACVWNGNNTAIDGCAGGTEGGCPLPGNPAGGGTIMSYCHLNVGINFNLGFGPQPGNVIRNTVLNAACLNSVCVVCDLSITDVMSTAPTACDVSDGTITVTATTSAGPITYSISGPVNQSNGTGVFTGLPGGSYQIEVEDGASCADFDAVAVGSFSTDVPVAIVDNLTVTSVLNFTGSGAITSIKLVGLNISHTFVGDLSATLTSPMGTVINLFDRPGRTTTGFGCGGNNIEVTFDDAAVLTAANFESTCNSLPPAIGGTYRSITPLSNLMGEESNGTWTLAVTDAAGGDGGNINGWGLDICTAPACDVAISDVAVGNETCPNANNGSITITATTSAGPLTYAISGPVNQSNGTGVFTNLPDGNYNITVTDNGATDCEATTTAMVAAGVDNTPPVPVCRTATVTLNPTGNYTLLSADVLNLGASFDNCGTVNFVSASPASVSCAQLGQTIPVTVTVNDGNGNTATCIATITVVEGTALPAGWSNADIGNAQGSAIYKPCTSNGQFTLTSKGFSNNPDLQHSAWRSLCGNGSITAHVASILNGGWAGVEIRENVMPGSRKVALKTQLTTFVRRVLRTVANTPAQTAQFPAAGHSWLRITRTGSNFVMYVSSNGTNWQQVGTATLALPNCVQIGLFAESINVNTTTTAVFDNVTVTGGIAPLATPGNSIVEMAAPDLQVYPNPTVGEVTVNLSAYANRAVRLELYDIQGKVLEVIEVNTSETSTERLDLSAYHNGIYLIRAQSEGLPDATKRVVVHGKGN